MTKTLEERLATVEADNINQGNQIEIMANDIKEIKDKLLGRPSWSVTLIITSLMTICSGLVMFILTR